jgi:hypothetical protein
MNSSVRKSKMEIQQLLTGNKAEKQRKGAYNDVRVGEIGKIHLSAKRLEKKIGDEFKNRNAKRNTSITPFIETLIDSRKQINSSKCQLKLEI